MKETIYPDDLSVDEFVYEVIYGKSGNFGNIRSALGFLDQTGMLEAGIVFHNYYKKWRRVEASIASINPRWLTKSRIEDIYRVVLALDCDSMITCTDPENRVARRIMKGLGGVEYIIKDFRGLGKDECLIVNTVEAFEDTIYGGACNGRRWT
jgi:hypothetical protein